MNGRSIVGGAACLWIAGCSAAADDAPRELVAVQRQAIVGGWDATRAPSVVALVDDANGVRCTGTLVSPRAVITAAHCKTAGATKVMFGASATAANARWSSIAAFVAHPDFDRKTLTSDIAIVSLATVAPADVAPALMSDDFIAPDFVGSHVALLGYGVDAVNGAPARRAGRATVSAVLPRTFQTLPDPSQPCHGDSGGPVLVDTEAATILLGVISSGDDKCIEHTTYTRLDAFRTSFVVPLLSKLADGAVRMGERCFHDKSCRDGGTCFAPNRRTDRAYCTNACARDGDCPAEMRCDSKEAGGLCAFDVTPGAVGATCLVDADCDSMQCTSDGDRAVCLQACIPGALPCPDGFVCTAERASGDRNGCRRSKGVATTSEAQAQTATLDSAGETSADGCTSAGARGSSSGSLAFGFSLLTVAGAWLRRRDAGSKARVSRERSARLMFLA